MKSKNVSKHLRFKLENKYLRNTYSILISSILLLSLNCISCDGQVNKAKISQPNPNKIKENLKSISPDSDSSLLLKNPSHSIKYNQYKNGKKDGLWRTSYANGQLKTEGGYHSGLKEGLHKEWDDNGTLLLEGFYEKGKANGLMKWFHEGGHLAGKGHMTDDIRNGEWKICDIQENGFCIDAYFKNGKRDGIWKIYHEDSTDKLWKEQTFEEDKMISEKCWDKNGKSIDCK